MSDYMDVKYIIEQLGEIQKQTSYLIEAILALSRMEDGDSGDCGAPGNVAGREKAKSLGDVVRCRETTNQKLIEFYELIYRDLRGLDQPSASEDSASPNDDSASPNHISGSTLNDLVSASKAFAAQVIQNDMAAE